MKQAFSKLHAARIRRLIKALRSGEYTQCKGRLRKADTFCIGGVACDLYRKSVYGKKANSYWSDNCFMSSGHASIGIIPSNVVSYFGIDMVMYTRKNDDGWSFARLARHLEKHLEKYS